MIRKLFNDMLNDFMCKWISYAEQRVPPQPKVEEISLLPVSPRVLGMMKMPKVHKDLHRAKRGNQKRASTGLKP